MKKLIKLLEKQPAFTQGKHDIWREERMENLVFEGYFDEKIPGGSKNLVFIQETVSLVKKLAPVSSHPRIVDLGCGPGRYSLELAKAGYDVTGIDYNQLAIEYAKKQSEMKKFEINYQIGDIKQFSLTDKVDVALLIYHVYGSFSPSERQDIFKKIYQSLRPDGLVILDVLTLANYDAFQEISNWGLSKGENEITQSKSIVFGHNIKYKDNVTLSKTVIVGSDGELVNFNYWNQYFSLADLKKEVEQVGFEVIKIMEDVNGGAYQEDGEQFAVVLQKKVK